MTKSGILVALLALGVATGTGLLVRNWLAREQAANLAASVADTMPGYTVVAADQTRVLTAAQRLPAGTLLRPEDLKWQPWPESGLTDGFVRDQGQALDEWTGAVVRRGLEPGEPLTRERVARPQDAGFLAAVLATDHRAVSVPLDASAGVSGFVLPGDRVDVIVTYSITMEDGTERWASETVVGGVRVLAVDQRFDDQSSEVLPAKTATLEVTPKQAEALTLMAALGKISLSLRAVAEGAAAAAARPRLTAAAGTTLDVEVASLFRRAAPAVQAAPAAADAPTPAAPQGRTVVLVQGEKREVLTMPGR